MDDQQRARELAGYFGVLYKANERCQLGAPFFAFTEKELQAFAAALSTVPEVGDGYVVLQRVDVKRLLAGDKNLPGYELSRRRIVGCIDLLNQRDAAIPTDGSKVVAPPALGAHKVHPDAVDTGLDVGEAGEHLVAAHALEHAPLVCQDCDGWTTVALQAAMTTLRQIASTPRNKGARMNAKATLLFLQTQLVAPAEGGT